MLRLTFRTVTFLWILSFLNIEQHPQTATGDIVQMTRIEYNLIVGMRFENFVNSLSELIGCFGGDIPIQGDDQNAILY